MKKIPINRWLALFVLFAFLFNACSASTQSPTATEVSPTQTYAPTKTSTPELTETSKESQATATNAATDTPTPATENTQYNTIDINHPLETCPVIADIKAYFDWLQNSPIEPFGPNAILRPLRIWDGGDPPYPISFDPNTDKNFQDSSKLSFRQSPNIVCYNSGQLQYLLLPTAWLDPNNPSKPIWTMAGFIYSYYGKGVTDKQLTQYIKDWLSKKPSFQVPAVDVGRSMSYEDDLQTQTANRYPDIKNRIYEFVNTGDASSVSAPDIILDPQIITG